MNIRVVPSPPRLGDVIANDPNACQPQLHPLNDPAPLTKWLPWLILGATVLGALAIRKGSR